jgi:hypothetical protein
LKFGKDVDGRIVAEFEQLQVGTSENDKEPENGRSQARNISDDRRKHSCLYQYFYKYREHSHALQRTGLPSKNIFETNKTTPRSVRTILPIRTQAKLPQEEQ